MDARMFYFGPWDRAGHSLVSEIGHSVYGSALGTFPWTDGEMDGQLQPHFKDCRMRGSSRYCECPGGPEGKALLHYRQGWTAISFWDRSVDKRNACNSSYFAKGTFTFDEMVEMAKRRFAIRWNKMNFEVTLISPEEMKHHA